MIDPGDLLDEAKDLARAGHGREVRRRSAISRAYYAAFHQAEAAARTAGYRFDRKAGTGMHAHLIAYLRGSGLPGLKGAAGILNALKDMRTLADYRLHDNVAMLSVKEAIEHADFLLTEILPPPEAG